MSLQPDQLLAGIFAAYMELDPSRIVVYNQNWEVPKDAGLYIIISFSDADNFMAKHEINAGAGIETSSVVSFTTYSVELISRGREAFERKEEAVMALHSQAALAIAEMHTMRVWRTGKTLDLSAIEGAGALSRYRFDVIISSLKEKETPASVLEGLENPVFDF